MSRPRFTQVTREDQVILFRKARIIIKSPCIDIKCYARMTSQKNSEAKLLIITPRAIGHAPYRNYLRRCTKEIFYNLALHTLSARWIVYYKKCSNPLTFHMLLETWEKAARNLPSLSAQ